MKMYQQRVKKQKIFSTANLVLWFFCIALFSVFFYKVHDLIFELPLFSIIIFSIIAVSLGVSICLKAPLFVNNSDNSNINDSLYDKRESKNLGFLGCLSFALLTLEPSCFVSFFSGVKLSLCSKDRICKFACENKKTKFIHRLLDFTLLFILIPIAYLLVLGLLSFGWKSGLCIFIIFTFLNFRKSILFYFLGIQVDTIDGYKINVIYPHRTVRTILYKMYGFAGCFTKTVFITDDTFRLNQTIKDYVIAHEMGHIKNRKGIFIHYVFFVLLIAYLSMGPDIFGEMMNNYFAYFIPIITYLIYKMTLGYRIHEKMELDADKYALQKIGKEKCLEALNVMKKDSVKQSNKNWLSRSIPLERRIQFIKDYEDKKD